ncbi:MHC class II transactivator isoform X19 [Cavia porcellus]|uniref:MHC class II transactivator isoform X19 n=1 Tax=Cavia porcellus TaxID=10141 RepID=UPI002FDF98BE
MNHFQTILVQVRALLSSHQPRQVQALLDSLLEEELLSREYHCALLHEPDIETLARKISLTLLAKADLDLALLGWAWRQLQAPSLERGPGCRNYGGSGQCATMELGPLEGGYLELLNSDVDPLHHYHLYDQMDLAGEQEIELYSALFPDLPSFIQGTFPPEPDMDTINCDQFSRLLYDMEREEETGDTYPNIAELDQYVFQDAQLEDPSKDIFIEHIGLEEVNSESVEVLEEAGQRSQKRSFPEEHPTDLKHRKLGEMPQAKHTLPASGPAVHSLPKSPTRPGSTSPFAPSAADLPSMPEPALTSRTDATGEDWKNKATCRTGRSCVLEDETSPPPCQATAEDAIQLSKWPEAVRQFHHSLQDWHQAEPTEPEVEVDLLRARLEKGSHKSQERELVIVDWAERQPVSGGLAEVLLAASNRRRLRETQVIAMLGKAGHGKSHWAQAVGRAWARGQLPQYDFVFYVPCYRLDYPGDTYCLKDLLCSPGPQPLAMDEEVFSHISRRPERILLILDAFEELEAQDSFLHGAGGPTCTEPCSFRALLAGLLQRRLMQGCTLLLMAQPRGRLAQVLGKADALFEVTGFSTEQAQTYVTCYFKGSEHREQALMLLQDQPFLLSHSHSPTLCRAVCQLLETLLQRGEEAKLPSTLTGLYVGLLDRAARDSPPGALVGLAKLAWELGRRHQSTLREDQFPTEQIRTWAVTKSLVQPVVQQVPGAAEAELAFSSFLLQCFLGALWLALSSEIKDKELPQFLALTPRKKRPYDNWMEGVPRFLAGLIFQPRARCLGALVGSAAAASADKKQKVLTRYLKRLQPRTLQAGRLLELLHCAHEASEAGIWMHVVRELPACLSFLGTRLTPPDAHVLGQALQAAGRDFSLDLRGTGIDPSGLGNLVGLSCVTRFRAALSDTVGLWESLQQRGETQLLQAAEDKFTIEPFKAKSLKDVEDLGHLVQTQRLRSSSEDTVRELPAVRDLKKLEFALGPTLGPQAFPKLAKILPAFSSLQHLDLDSLSDNKIGDTGVSQLSATFPQLKALETLNLSQNSITDTGACTLAEALPLLSASLLRLSLYNNCICDMGAESLARVLPEMGSLRVMDVQFNKFTAVGAQQLAASLRKCPRVETLAMWTPTIPFGVQEHLHQLDSRISLR